jgi:hypothetical protein
LGFRHSGERLVDRSVTGRFRYRAWNGDFPYRVGNLVDDGEGLSGV